MDNLDFINRHHNRRAAYHSQKARKSLSAAVIVSIMALYFVLVLFVVQMAHVDDATIWISILVFITATLVAFVAKRAQHLQAKQEKELVLLKEVLEGSRGGRLITDSADNTLYYNQRFVELCPINQEDIKKKSFHYEALVDMFCENDQATALFSALSDQAHRGLTDAMELYCEQRDSFIPIWPIHPLAARPMIWLKMGRKHKLLMSR